MKLRYQTIKCLLRDVRLENGLGLDEVCLARGLVTGVKIVDALADFALGYLDQRTGGHWLAVLRFADAVRAINTGKSIAPVVITGCTLDSSSRHATGNAVDCPIAYALSHQHEVVVLTGPAALNRAVAPELALPAIVFKIHVFA